MPTSPPPPAASVAATLSSLSSGAKLRDDATRQDYDDYQSQNDYEVVSGTVFMPNGAPCPADTEGAKAYQPVIAIKLFEDYRVRTVTTTAKKHKVPPILPAAKSVGRWLFAGGSYSVGAPTMALDGQQMLWNASATVRFVEQANLPFFQGLVLGDTAFQTESESRMTAQPTPPFNGDERVVGTEDAPGPRLGQCVGSYLDPLDPFYGLRQYNGCYSVVSYYPGQLFSDTLIAGGRGLGQGLPAYVPPPPPASPPPP